MFHKVLNLNIEEIRERIRYICYREGYDYDLLISSSRNTDLVCIRCSIIYILRNKFMYIPLVQLSNIFNRTDHSTALNAIKMLSEREYYPKVNDYYNSIVKYSFLFAEDLLSEKKRLYPKKIKK